MANPNTTEGDAAPVLTPTEARQGGRGRHILWVLGISMGLIVAIYAVMVIGVQGSHLNQAGGQTSVDQKTLQQTGGSTNTLQAPK
jgi:hypothetical protein